MHPPTQSIKVYNRRQPLQQIQQSNNNTKSHLSETLTNLNHTDCKTTFRTSNKNELSVTNENNSNGNIADNYGNNNVKQIHRGLKNNSNSDAGQKGVLLANIVSGNYNNSQRVNNENGTQSTHKNSRSNDAGKHYSQENIAPNNKSRGNLKYNNRGNGNYAGNFNRYVQSTHYNNGKYNHNSSNRRYNQHQAEQINKDDRRYTAKYWTSTASDNETKNSDKMTNENTDIGNNSTNTSTSNSSDSSIVDINRDVSDKKSTRLLNKPTNEDYKISEKNLKTSTQQRPVTNQKSLPQKSFHHTKSNRNQHFINDIEAKSSHNDSSNFTKKESMYKNQNRSKNALQGIDLRNHASVVIVDYLPESAVTTRNSSCESLGNHTDDDEIDSGEIDDGFQQVMTKKKKKAEKMKAAAAAANLINKNKKTSIHLNNRSRRVSFNGNHKYKNAKERTLGKNHRTDNVNSSKKTDMKTLDSSPTSLLSNSSQESNQNKQKSEDFSKTSNQANQSISKTAIQKYNQVVNNTKNSNSNKTINTACAKIIQNSKEESGNISPSVDLNFKIESCKKVWDLNSRIKSQNRVNEQNTHHDSEENVKSKRGPVVNLIDNVINDVLEPLMKSPIQSLMNSYYDKNLMKQVESNSAFSAFSDPTLNLAASLKQQNLDDSNSSAKTSNHSMNSANPCLPSDDVNTEINKISSSGFQCIAEPINQVNPTIYNSREEIIPSSNACSNEYPIQNSAYISYPLSSSANHLVNNIIIKNVSNSPSPSVSSYLSMPSLSNSSFYQPQAPVLPPQTPAQQPQQICNNYYHPFSSQAIPFLNQESQSSITVKTDNFVDNLVSQEQFYPPIQVTEQNNGNQQFPTNIQSTQTFIEQQQVPVMSNLSQPMLLTPLSYQSNFTNGIHPYDHQLYPVQNHIVYNQHIDNEKKSLPSNIVIPFNNQMNSSMGFIPTGPFAHTMPDSVKQQHHSHTQGANNLMISSYQQKPGSNEITKTYNPFNSNPFNPSEQIANPSDSSSSFTYSNATSSFNQPSQLSLPVGNQSNSNLYSLFNSSNKTNTMTSDIFNSNTKSKLKQSSNASNQQIRNQITPSASSSSMNKFAALQNNQPLRTSPDYPQVKNNDASNRQSSNAKNNPGLIDHVPFFDNTFQYENFNNQQINSDQLNFNTYNPNFQANNLAYFNYKNAMLGYGSSNNSQMNPNMHHESVNNQMNYALDAPIQQHISYNARLPQQVQYVQSNKNQAPLLSQPNYQSPLLPQPPQISSFSYASLNNHSNKEYIPCYNQNNMQLRYSQYQPNNRGNYVKNHVNNSSRKSLRSQHYQNLNMNKNSNGGSSKSASSPKAVQKITILPKPKSNGTLTPKIKPKNTSLESTSNK